MVAAIGQRAGVIAGDERGVQRRVIRPRARRVFRHDQPRARLDACSGGDGEAYAVGEFPPAHVHSGRSGVVKFQPFVAVVVADRVEENFADEHVRRPGAGVRRARRRGGERAERSLAIVRPTEAHIRGGAAEAHGIEHARAGGVGEVKGLAFSTEREAKLRLGEGDTRSRPERGAGGDREFL